MIDYYNQMADSYAGMYDSAPETVERVECDWTFHSSDYYMSDADLWEGNEQFEPMKKTMRSRQ